MNAGAGGGRPTVAVLGLGEAGSLIAADLVAAGAEVRAFDPLVAVGLGMTGAVSDAEAAAGCSVVIAVTSAHDAQQTLDLTLPGLASGAVYADLNTAPPATKRQLADTAAAAGVTFADVALMSPVPGSGLGTPMLTSGAGAERFALIFNALGATVEVLPGPAGVAATRKLLRSVFYKGLAAAVIEALQAGRAAGSEKWLRDNIRAELAGMDHTTVDRLERGSVRHARRRFDEMSAAADLLDELGVPYRVTLASRDWMRQLAGPD